MRRPRSTPPVPTVDGQTVDVKTLNALWYRRMSPKQILPDGADADYHLHINVSQELLDSDDTLALTPAIYQECIPGERHLRISVVGERCDGALIEAKDLDWRYDLNVPFRPYPLDSNLEQGLCATLRELGLVMGIFDVKLTGEDEPVFLEVNSQGQFLFVEGLCGMPLADQFAAFLVDRAMQSVRSPQGVHIVGTAEQGLTAG